MGVCVCVRACVRACVCVTFVDARITLGDRDVIFFKLRGITPDIICKSLTKKSDYKFQYGGQNGSSETLYLTVTQPFINMATSFFLLNCV